MSVKVRGMTSEHEGGQVATIDAPPETIRVPEAAQILGLSRNGAYAAVARGEIPVIRIGRKLLVPRKRLMAMIDPSARGDAA